MDSPANPSPRRTMYFQPGIIRLLIEHPAEFERGQLLEAQQQLGLALPSNAQLLVEQIATFVHPSGKRQRRGNCQPRQSAFSVVPYRVPELAEYTLPNIRDLITIINRLNTQILEQKEATGDVLARIASPDWLSAPSPENTGGGGPGARPVPASIAPEFFTSEVDTAGAPFCFQAAALPDFQPRATTRAVDVAILDTAYPTDALIDAYNRFSAQHPVIRSLLEPDGAGGLKRLTVHTAAEIGITLPAPGEIKVERHNYPMNDHGLFVAGIVHSTAPTAQLHLYQVLNEYGVGSTQGIARTLQQIAQQQAAIPAEKRRPLVVNCSLMIVMPLPGQRKLDASENDDLVSWELFNKSEAELQPEDWYLLDQLCLDLDWACDALRDNGVLVIAAAGNDANNGSDVNGGGRPRARFPAAFSSVEGIGALEKNSTVMTGYSNQSDRPAYKGIATLGGNATVTLNSANEIIDSATVPGLGVLGAYIGAFPGDKPNGFPGTQDSDYPLLENTTGWAWWAGTSFASPAIAGSAAALIGHGLPPASAIAAIRAAQPELTSDTSEIFMITQG